MAVVSVTAADFINNAARTVTVTGATAGNWLVAFAVNDSAASAPVITTTAGTTSAWTSRFTATDGGNFYSHNGATATVTTSGNITVSASQVAGGIYTGLVVFEVDNVASYDGQSNATNITSNNFDTGSRTPGSYNAMAVGIGVNWTGSTPTVNDSATDQGSGLNYPGFGVLGRFSNEQVTSGAAQLDYTAGGNPNHAGMIVLIESGVVGGGTTGPMIKNSNIGNDICLNGLL